MVAYVVDAELDHIPEVAANMRQDDVLEIWASGRCRPLLALHNAFLRSKYIKTIMVDGVPVGMFGVTPLSTLTRKGSPWLLGTPALEKVSIAFLRGCQTYVPDMLSGYSSLENYVDARNRVAIAWLRWLGFDILAPEPYGHLDLPFHKFVMENPDV